MTFKSWLITQAKKDRPKVKSWMEERRLKITAILDWAELDFAEDVASDSQFPVGIYYWEELKEYLDSKIIVGTLHEAIVDAARTAFIKWQANDPRAKADCFNGADIEKIKKALRLVWSWSYPRQLVLKRCKTENGFSRCEKCRKQCPKVAVDHIVPVGTYDEGFISRLFVPSSQLQGLCVICHKAKTRLDLISIRQKKCIKKIADFF